MTVLSLHCGTVFESGGEGKSGGENSLQAFLTGFCPLAKIPKAMGIKAVEVFKL